MLTTSVIIPVYNCQLYITQAIQSALAQQVDEVIVVDDGSTDDTPQAVQAIDDPRLRYVHQTNQGVSSARNRGINLAAGTLVAFLDADDYFLPNKLAQQRALFESDPSLGLVQSGWQRVDESGALIDWVTPWAIAPDLTLENFLRFKPVLPSALMVRRDWLIRVGGFDVQLQAAEDVDLVCRLALEGCCGQWLKEIAVSYRQHRHSAMGNGLVQARDLTKFLNKFFQQPDLPNAVRLQERSVRYHTLVWAAWYLYDTGYLPEMAEHLKQAWNHTPYLPIEALIHWSDSFAEFSQVNQLPDQLAGQPLALTEYEDWQQLVRWLLNQHPKNKVESSL